MEVKATGQKAALPSKIAAGTSRKEAAPTPTNSGEQTADKTTEATRATTTTVTDENDSSTGTASTDLMTSQTEERPMEKSSKVWIPFDLISNGKMHEKIHLSPLQLQLSAKAIAFKKFKNFRVVLGK